MLQKYYRYPFKQQGFIALLVMLMLVVGTAVWFGTISGLQSEKMQVAMQDEHMRELKRIKQRMLTFAVMGPEIYYSETSGTPNYDEIPGPGYFPCPDTDGDGLPNNGPNYPCGSGQDFVTGMVPLKAIDNDSPANILPFSFIDKPVNANRYWFSVDSRFVTDNCIASHRYLPLNADSPSSANLTLDGRSDIVMVLFYAGDPLSGQNQSSLTVSNFLELENADGNAIFVTKSGNPENFNDFVISITREEWRAAVLSRVSKDVLSDDDNDGFPETVGSNDIPDLCEYDWIRNEPAHWFNRCLFNSTPCFVGNETETDTNRTCNIDFSSIDENHIGQNWREFFNCP